MEKNEPKYSIVSRFGSLSPEGRKVTKEVNLVQWEGMSEPVFDIRKWDADGKPHRGISLTGDELAALCKILKENCPGYF